MTKKQKIDQLIEEHKCQVNLRVHFPPILLVTYSYDWDAGTSCGFEMLCEVAESLQEAFQTILKRRGLVHAGNRECDGRDGQPKVQDLLTPTSASPAGLRWRRLMPEMIPTQVRVYDNGGIDVGGSIDRYTVVFTGRAACARLQGRPDQWPFLAMSSSPFHPQGFGQHGHTDYRPCDVTASGRTVAVGRKNHLGTRINFTDLPDDCRRLVIRDYLEIWKL